MARTLQAAAFFFVIFFLAAVILITFFAAGGLSYSWLLAKVKKLGSTVRPSQILLYGYQAINRNSGQLSDPVKYYSTGIKL